MPPVGDQSPCERSVVGANFCSVAVQNQPLTFVGCRSGRSQPLKSHKRPLVQMYFTCKINKQQQIQFLGQAKKATHTHTLNWANALHSLLSYSELYKLVQVQCTLRLPSWSPRSNPVCQRLWLVEIDALCHGIVLCFRLTHPEIMVRQTIKATLGAHWKRT